MPSPVLLGSQRPFGQQGAQIAPCVAALDLRHIFWRAGRNDSAPAVPTFGPHINQPIRRFDDIKIVFDHNNRVALVHKLVEHLEQFAHILEMQTGCRLVEDIQRAPG